MNVLITYDPTDPLKCDIVDANTGEHIEGVCDIKIHIVPNDLPTATLTIRKFKVNIVARAIRKIKNIWRF